MPRMSHTLKHLLSKYTNDTLQRLIRVAKQKFKASKKPELVGFLYTYLTNETNLKRIWDSMDACSRKAVSHAFHNDGIFNLNAFYGHYQKLPQRPGTSRFFQELIPLDLLILHRRIPLEIMPLIATWVDPKESFVLNGSQEMPEASGKVKPDAPIYVVDTEWAGYHDLLSLLDLARLKRIKIAPKSKRLTLKSARFLAYELCNEDFLPVSGSFEVAKTIRVFGLHKFAEHSGMLKRGALTKKGAAYLEQRSPDLLLDAFEHWTEKGKFDERSRVTGLKGRNGRKTKYSTPEPRREAVIEALSWCPVNEWIDFEAFKRAVFAWGFKVKVGPDRKYAAICSRTLRRCFPR